MSAPSSRTSWNPSTFSSYLSHYSADVYHRLRGRHALHGGIQHRDGYYLPVLHRGWGQPEGQGGQNCPLRPVIDSGSHRHRVMIVFLIFHHRYKYFMPKFLYSASSQRTLKQLSWNRLKVEAGSRWQNLVSSFLFTRGQFELINRRYGRSPHSSDGFIFDEFQLNLFLCNQLKEVAACLFLIFKNFTGNIIVD